METKQIKPKQTKTKQTELTNMSLEPFMQGIIEGWLKANDIKATDVRHNIRNPVVYYNPVVNGKATP